MNSKRFLFLITLTAGLSSCNESALSGFSESQNKNLSLETHLTQISKTALNPQTNKQQGPQTKPPPPQLASSSSPTNLATPTHFEPLAWEDDPQIKSQTTLWSKMIYHIIEKQTPEILGQNVADDVEIFCPRYRSLTDMQRMNFWAQLIVGIAKFESGWTPTATTIEYKMMGSDAVTGKHIASEGLLQISYQDEKNYPIQCGFNWAKDKNLSQKDPRKTILDPYLNLNCGLQIFSYQLKTFRTIVAKNSRQLYWAVLYNGQSNKIKEISEMTKSLSFCK